MDNKKNLKNPNCLKKEKMQPYHKDLIKTLFQTQKPIAILKPRFNYGDFINDVRITMHKALGLPMDFLKFRHIQKVGTMTDKIINLKADENLNEKIIKEKGNTKCIFYNDDICRNGDKTRDCINCARIEYRSLYKLNWDNQERLYNQLKCKEQECEKLKKELKIKTYHWEKATEEILKGTQ